MFVNRNNQYKNMYEFKGDNYVALFNSLNMELVYLSNTMYSEFTASDTEFKDKLINELGLMTQPEEDKNPILYIGSMYLLLTSECNLNCKYCTVRYNNETGKVIGNMTFETISKALKLLAQGDKSYKRQLTLYGGEPLINKEGLEYALQEIKKYNAYGYNIEVTLITNGVLLNEQIAQLLKDNDVFTIVSIDGIEKNHNQYRTYDGSITGSYNETIRGYNLLKDYGNKTGISLVIGNHNFDDLVDICHFFKETLRVDSLGVTLPHICPVVDDKIDWSSEGCQRLEDVLNKCCEMNLWNEQLMKKITPIINKKVRFHGCPAPSNSCMIRVLPNGNITLCENLGLRNKYNIGNILEIGDMEEIINNQYVQEWYQRTPLLFDECHNCYAIGICGAGCPYDAFLENGTINSVEKRNCYISKMIVRWFIDKVYEKMDNKNANLIKPQKADLEKVLPNRPI